MKNVGKLKEITCIKCGQTISPLTESWNGHGAEKQHVTCPISKALQDVSTVPAEQGDTQNGTSRLLTTGKPTIPDFLTLPEVAKKLRVSDSTVRRYVRDGQLPAKRLPGRRGPGTLLFAVPDVLALLEDA